MFSIPLLKWTIKSNYKIFLIFIAVLAMYFAIILGMYDPSTQDSMRLLMAKMPKELMSAFGFEMAETSLIGFLSSYYYGFIIIVFPMLFEIIVANKLIAKQVDKGVMGYLISTPNTRTKIALTQAGFLLGSITIIMAFVTILGIVLCEKRFPGELDVQAFLLLNVGALLLHYAISGISFFASCIFNDTKNSVGIGAGIPVAFYIIQMLANVGGKLENFKYATLFTLFNPQDIIALNSRVLSSFIMLGVLTIVLYIIGTIRFAKRDLSL